MSSTLFHRRSDSDASSKSRTVRLPPSLRNLKLSFTHPKPETTRPILPPPSQATPSPVSPAASKQDAYSGASDAEYDDGDADSLFSTDDATFGNPSPDAAHCAHCAHCLPLDAAHALISQLETLVETLSTANVALRRRITLLRATVSRLASELQAERHKSSSDSAPTERVQASPAPPPDTSFGSGLTDLINAFPPTSPTSERSDAFYSIRTQSSDTLPIPLTPNTYPSSSSQHSRTHRSRPRRNTGASSVHSPKSPIVDPDALAVPSPAALESASVRSLPFAQRKPARTAPAAVSFEIAHRSLRLPRPSAEPIRRSPAPPAPAAGLDARTKIPVLSTIRSSARKFRDTISRRQSIRPAG